MINLIKSTFYKEKITKKKLTSFILKAKQLSFGPQCQEFEKKFAAWQGRKYCVLLNSGSSANLAIIQTFLNLGRIKKGDAIGFSALTWSTNVMPLIELGLQAVPIDVDIQTLNVSSKTLGNAIKKHHIKAFFLTNLLGFCSDISEIEKICHEKNILFFEDNCESLGTIYKGKKLGNFGVASTFSFYVGHHMSTVEGGAVCTDDEELMTMLTIVRAHGWDRNLDFTNQTQIRNKFKVNSTFYSRYTFYELGYNFRPTEIAGFLGNTQIKYLDEIIQKRKENFFTIAPHIYSQKDKYYSLNYEHLDLVSNFAIPIICKSQEIRDELVKRSEGKVEIRPIVGGDIALQPFFVKYMKDFLEKNPNAELVHRQGLYFGNNPELTHEEINKLISIFAG